MIQTLILIAEAEVATKRHGGHRVGELELVERGLSLLAVEFTANAVRVLFGDHLLFDEKVEQRAVILRHGEATGQAQGNDGGQ
ncbi:MAG: hypothetical protein QM796_05885 [Chthoniobacteraceae bacterium]